MNTSICIPINTKFVYHNRDTTVRMCLEFRLQSSNGCELMEIKRKKLGECRQFLLLFYEITVEN